MGIPPFGATTFKSKSTSRSPVTVPFLPAIPCAVWQVEHVKPALMWMECRDQLVFWMILPARSWHLPHIAYGPFTVRSGLG